MNKQEMIKAINLALNHKWDEAHNLVQQYENEATACWIHAVLHKIEGDLSNSRYWYRRAQKMEHEKDPPVQELNAIKAELAADSNEDRELKR